MFTFAREGAVMDKSTPLSQDEKRRAFLAAVCSFQNAKTRWAERQATGLSDEQLESALKHELEIFGGRCTHDGCPSISYQCAGLKIWAGWGIVNHCQEKPIFEGAATIAMAREIFSIADTEDNQLPLF
jgi:hypothetical protein